MEDMRRMTVGQVVDFCISYNQRQKAFEKEEKRPKSIKRKANQNDINAFFG